VQGHKGAQGTRCSPRSPLPTLPPLPRAGLGDEAPADKHCGESPAVGSGTLSVPHHPQQSDKGMPASGLNVCSCRVSAQMCNSKGNWNKGIIY